MNVRLLGVGFLATIACSCTGVNGPRPSGYGVLFLGNSLTSVNDLPGMFKAVASTGGDTVQVSSLALPDHALIDYVLDGSASATITGRGWEHVVLQQGPTTLPICRDTLVMSVQAIEQMARTNGGHSIVMMSWPSISRPFDFAAVHASAEQAAITANAQFAPVGDAWQAAMLSDPSIQPYGPDGYHPSAVGTYIATLVLYEQVTGKDARQLPPVASARAAGLTLSSESVAILQRVAHDANVNAFSVAVPVWVRSPPPNPPITC